jgi:hypothetical protein
MRSNVSMLKLVEGQDDYIRGNALTIEIYMAANRALVRLAVARRRCSRHGGVRRARRKRGGDT